LDVKRKKHSLPAGGDSRESPVGPADTGPGMPETVKRDIFKPFFKTKPPAEGTGLGLYICREVVEKHGGTISVESEVGQGSVFTVRIPVTYRDSVLRKT